MAWVASIIKGIDHTAHHTDLGLCLSKPPQAAVASQGATIAISLKVFAR